MAPRSEGAKEPGGPQVSSCVKVHLNWVTFKSIVLRNAGDGVHLMKSRAPLGPQECGGVMYDTGDVGLV